MKFMSTVVWAILSAVVLAMTPSHAELISENQHFQPIRQNHNGYHSFIPYVEVDGIKSHLPLTSPTAKVVIDFYGKPMTIDLRRNDALITGNFHHSHQENGKTVRHRGLYQPFCHYHGKIRQSSNPQPDLDNVAISACQALTGVFQYKNQDYGIQQLDNDIHGIYTLNDHHGRLQELHKPFKYVDKIHKAPHHRDLLPDGIRYRRNTANTIKYVELVAVNDKRTYDLFSGNLTAVEGQIITVINMVDLRYKPLSVRVLLTGVVTWSQQDQILFNDNGTATLSRFSDYAIKTLRLSNPYDNAQLFTGITLANEAGIAYVSSMCYGNSVGVIENTVNIPEVALITAHELGHNFGMEHDNGRSCVCTFQPPTATQCIMAAVIVQPYAQTFSNCSNAELQAGLAQGLGSCLFNIPTKLFTNPVCGNGIRETGEECDCGTASECTTNCCNTTTCKLLPSAQCATGPCCSNCQFKQRSTLCRAAENECDLPEYCSGKASECPANIYKQSSLSCGNNTAYCYNGACFNPNAQCRLLWGPTGRESDAICWNNLNVRGTAEGYCKANANGYVACAPADVKCGKLQCHADTNQPVITLGNITLITLTLNGVVSKCNSFTANLGGNVPNPGVVLNGAKCGNQKICLNQQCQDLSTAINITQCNPIDCSNHGVCNNKGNCHCDAGYAPPDCNQPGNGGSIDSHGNSTAPPPTTVTPAGPTSGATVTATSTSGALRLCSLQSLGLLALWSVLLMII